MGPTPSDDLLCQLHPALQHAVVLRLSDFRIGAIKMPWSSRAATDTPINGNPLDPRFNAISEEQYVPVVCLNCGQKAARLLMGSALFSANLNVAHWMTALGCAQ